MKRNALPGDEDGPGQKRLAHTTQQVHLHDGQAQGSATDACIPQQVLPRLTLSQRLKKLIQSCTESIWSGTLKFHTRPQSQSNDQRQAMAIRGCRVRSDEKINTVNWPKQLKIIAIPDDDFIKKLNDLRVKRTTQRVTLSMDEDCDQMSHTAIIQSTSIPNCGCVLVEYTSSGISLLILRSFQFRDEVVIAGHILKCTYQDRAVEFLTDLGILSHATTANMHAKENASLKERVQKLEKECAQQESLHQAEMMSQILIAEEKSEKLAMIEMEMQMDEWVKDKDEELRKKDIALVNLKKEMKRLEKMLAKENASLKEEVEMQKTMMAEKEKEQARVQRERDGMQKQIIEKDRALSEKEEEFIERDRALSEKEKELKKKDEALSEKQSELIVKDITLMEKEERIWEKERALSDLKQEQNELQHEKDKVEEQLQMCQRALNNAQHLDAEREKTIVQPNIEEDTNKILEMEASRLELVNEVNTKNATLDAIGEMIENEFKCSICKQLFIKTTTLNCYHSFCAFCIKTWLDTNGTCPLCRSMTTSSVCSVVIDNYIDKIVNKLGDEAKQRRKETVREREETISTERYGQPYVILDDDDESDDQSSTVTSPSSSTTYLRSPASTMSTYHPSPASTMSTYHPSPASSYWRSPSSIANMFSPPSVSSTNTASPAAT